MIRSINRISSALLLFMSTSLAQNLQLDGSVVSSAGVFAISSSFELGASVGQPLVHSYSSTNFSAESGFWETVSAMSSETLSLLSLAYNSGWNIVGLPLEVNDAQYQTLFPEAYTGAFYSYDASYNLEEELSVGTGYLLRLANGGTVDFVGLTIDDLTLSFTEGWNLVSGISTTIDVSVLYGSGIIAIGGIYGYDGGYMNANMLEPGRGYWVRALSDGEIVLAED